MVEAGNPMSNNELLPQCVRLCRHDSKGILGSFELLSLTRNSSSSAFLLTPAMSDLCPKRDGSSAS